MKKERKIYTSFHDISPREYMYFPKGTIDMGTPGKFSRLEVIHLFVSMGVLTIAFAFAITDNSIVNQFSHLDNLPMGLVLSFVGIVTAFFFHEMAHKIMAQKYGLWSEYRMFPMGLVVALFLAFFAGFVFAAPGAVMFRGESRGFETGRIAMAGPLTNIFIALVTLPLYILFFYETQIGIYIGFIGLINAFLATFNLLPFGPLDGAKVVRWNVNVWFLMFIVSVVLMVFAFQKPPVFL